MDYNLSELAGLPAEAPPQGPDMANADAVGQDTVDAIAGTAVPQPKPGILSNTTVVDPKTGEQTHTLKVTDQFLQNIGQLVGVGQQAISAYDQQVRAVQAKQQFLQEHPLVAAVGRLSSLAAANYFDPRNRLNGAIRAAGAFGQDYFGQSPEQLGAQVSQLQAQKLQTQMGLASVLEKGSAAEQAGQLRKDALAQQMAEQKASLEQKKNADLDKIATDALGASARNESNPVAATAAVHRYLARGGDPEAAKALGVQLIETQKAALAKETNSENFKAEQQARMFAQQSAEHAKQIGAMLTMFDKRADQQDKQAAEKSLTITGPTLTTLQGQTAVLKHLNDIKQLYTDYANNTGMFAGRVMGVEQKLGLLKSELAKMSTMTKATNAMLVTAFGEGTRGFQKAGLEYNAAMNPSPKFSLPQNLGAIEGLRDTILTKQNGVAASLSQAQVANYINMFDDKKGAMSAAYPVTPFEAQRLQKAGFDINAVAQKFAGPQAAAAPAAGAKPDYIWQDGKLVPVGK